MSAHGMLNEEEVGLEHGIEPDVPKRHHEDQSRKADGKDESVHHCGDGWLLIADLSCLGWVLVGFANGTARLEVIGKASQTSNLQKER